jgi:hypothetical protein
MKNVAVWLVCVFSGATVAAEIKVLTAGAVEPGLRAAASTRGSRGTK